MKEFLKWLGVNEKVAKVGICLFIFMAFLIVFNTFLESIGLPFYRITYENLSKIEVNHLANCIVSWIGALINFYTMILLVFRVSEGKKVFKYALVYLIVNILLLWLTNPVIVDIYIFLYILGFCYLYSGKNEKYILYGLGSYIVTVLVQFMCYQYKVRFINFEELNSITKNLLGLDYFLIMIILIIVKEIYLKKRGAKNETIR